MNSFTKPIHITEQIQCSSCDASDITHRLKITNISNEYLNDVKLIIDTAHLSIISEVLIRKRGSLSYNPPIDLLEIGNLSPSESAYFECTIASAPIKENFSSYLSLHFTPEKSQLQIHEKFTTFLSHFPPNTSSNGV